MRIHELAKELNISSKEAIALVEKAGGAAKSHMSLVEDAVADAIRKKVSSKTAKAPALKKEDKKEIPSQVKAAAPQASTKSVAAVSEMKSALPKKVEKKTASPEPVQAKTQEVKKELAPPPPPAPIQPEVKSEPLRPQPPSGPKPISIKFPITVGNLAAEINLPIPKLIKALMDMGIFANVNQLLNEEIVLSVAEVLQVAISKDADEIEKLLKEDFKDEPKQLKFRPPVVTMMGHVDHGKTSLLDAIRTTNVAGKEAGAITQHIGAYGVDIPGKGHVTFLDTPGHEAFTAMRARGANITDIVVLVVAADDGIMPQTVEAIDHAREARCPIMVAINKVDLPSADVQRTMRGLQQHELMPEVWGGKTVCVEVSAKTGKGIDNLLEMILLQSEIMELKANPDCPASGTVIESHLSKGSGPVATVIVQRGTLKVGDIVVSGIYTGRVKALKNDIGKAVKEAKPSYAVTVMGLNGVPEAGETFMSVEEEKIARKLTEQKALQKRELELSGGAKKHLSLEDLYERLSEGNFKELKIIIKADVQGSMEALSQSLAKASNDQCVVRVIHQGIGGINESDVMLAAASDAVILGFHVIADAKAQRAAQEEGVSLRFYNIIYEAVEDVQKAMEGLLEPTYNEVIDGRIEIRKTFQSSKVGTIGGGYVIKGKVSRANHVRLIRNNVVVFDGKLGSLKRFKDDVREVAQGYECGVAVEGYNDLKEGDIVESYRLEKIQSKLTRT